MSAELAIRAAMLAALKGDAALMAVLNGAYDGMPEGAPVRLSAPYAVVGESLASDWGTKDGDGREVRIGLTLADRGDTSERLAQMLERADAVVRGMAGPVAGWSVNIAFLRSRVIRARDQEWRAMLDYRVRMLRVA